MVFHERRVLDTSHVVVESLLLRQSRHADVDAFFFGSRSKFAARVLHISPPGADTSLIGLPLPVSHPSFSKQPRHPLSQPSRAVEFGLADSRIERACHLRSPKFGPHAAGLGVFVQRPGDHHPVVDHVHHQRQDDELLSDAFCRLTARA
jgi:hypothetical protein